MPVSSLQTRKLRVYAFDPSLGKRLSTSRVNEITIAIPNEMEIDAQHSQPGSLRAPAPGPIGKYLEVVDYDPSSGLFYDPVDLNTDEIRANQGLTPSMTAIRSPSIRVPGRRAKWYWPQSRSRSAEWRPADRAAVIRVGTGCAGGAASFLPRPSSRDQNPVLTCDDALVGTVSRS